MEQRETEKFKAHYDQLLFHEEEDRFHQLFYFAPVGVGEIDPKTNKILRVNPRYCQIVGYKEEELLKMKVEDITHPDELAEDRMWMDKLIHGKTIADFKEYSREKRCIRKDGRIIWIDLRVTPLRNKEGKILFNLAVINDITERKKVQEELETVKERFKAATIATGVGVWELNLKTKIAWTSESHDRIFGYKEPVKEWNVDIFLKHVHPDDRDYVHRELLGSALKGNLNIEFRVLRPDQSIRWMCATGHLIKDKKGENILLVGTNRDITERKKLEDESERARHELMDFFMQTPVAMAFLAGPEHKYTLVNPPFIKIFGKNPVGLTIKESFTNWEEANFVQQLDNVFESGKPFTGHEMPYPKKDRLGKTDYLFLDVNYHPVYNSDGSIKGILAYVADVTEKVLIKQKISEVLNAIPLCITRIDTNEKFIFTNKTNEKYFGPSENIVGKTVEELFGRHYDFFKPHVQSALKGNIEEYEWNSFPLLDGQCHNFIVKHLPEVSSNGTVTGFISCLYNIDRLKKTEYELKETIMQVDSQKKHLVEERDLRERFVSTLSHDLRTPLAAAKIASQVLSRKITAEPSLVKTIHRLTENLDRVDFMIRDLLDASYISAGQALPLRIEETDLRTIIDNVIENFAMVSGDLFRVKGKDSLVGQWDAEALKRILENLISNAIKYGKHLGVITVTLDEIDHTAIIKVHNEGNPIHPDERAKLFKIYSRSDSAKRGGKKGWGLGLALVKGLVESHRGSITVESSAESGTEFIIQLPRHDQEP